MLMTPKWIPPDIISDEALDSYIQVSPKSHHVISVSAAMLTFPKKEKRGPLLSDKAVSNLFYLGQSKQKSYGTTAPPKFLPLY